METRRCYKNVEENFEIEEAFSSRPNKATKTESLSSTDRIRRTLDGSKVHTIPQRPLLCLLHLLYLLSSEF